MVAGLRAHTLLNVLACDHTVASVTNTEHFHGTSTRARGTSTKHKVGAHQHVGILMVRAHKHIILVN